MVSSISSASYSAYDTTSLLQKLFKKLDTNGDGSVTESELKTALQTTDPGVSDSTVSALFNELDTDGSGSISESELESAGQQMAGPPSPPDGQGGPGDMSVSDMAQSLFSAADTDGSGTITESQLEAAMVAQQPGTQTSSDQTTLSTSVSEMAKKLFAAADTSGSGTITESELESAMKQVQPPPPADSSQNAPGDTTGYDSRGNATQQAFQSLWSLVA